MQEKFKISKLEQDNLEYQFAHHLFESTISKNMKVVTIEKCQNQAVQQRFQTEFKLTVQKYQDKCPT